MIFLAFYSSKHFLRSFRIVGGLSFKLTAQGLIVSRLLAFNYSVVSKRFYLLFEITCQHTIYHWKLWKHRTVVSSLLEIVSSAYLSRRNWELNLERMNSNKEFIFLDFFQLFEDPPLSTIRKQAGEQAPVQWFVLIQIYHIAFGKKFKRLD